MILDENDAGTHETPKGGTHNQLPVGQMRFREQHDFAQGISCRGEQVFQLIIVLRTDGDGERQLVDCVLVAFSRSSSNPFDGGFAVPPGVFFRARELPVALAAIFAILVDLAWILDQLLYSLVLK